MAGVAWGDKLEMAERDRDLASHLLVVVLQTLSVSRTEVARKILADEEVSTWWLNHKRKENAQAAEVLRRNLKVNLNAAMAKVDDLKEQMRQIGRLGGIAGAPLIAAIHSAEQHVEQLKRDLA